MKDKQSSTIYLDKDYRIEYSTCSLCKHYIEKYKCEAFEEISIEIWNNYDSHKKPYPGDKGIRFEKIVK